MATKYDDGVPVSSNVRTYRSTTNNSSARKYLGRDQTSSDDAAGGLAQLLSNADHVVGQAAGLKISAMVAAAAARVGRDSLNVVRDFLENTDAKPRGDVPAIVVDVSDEDVAVAQRNHSDDIIEAMGLNDQTSGDRFDSSVRDFVRTSSRNFFPSKQGDSKSSANTAIPEIDHLVIDVDSKKGSVDCFYARLTFSLSRKDVEGGKISAVRVFRSTVLDPRLSRGLGRMSIVGVDRIRSDGVRSRSKNHDSNSMMEKRLDESGIDNSISSLIPLDPLRKLRRSSDISSPVFSSPAAASSFAAGEDSRIADLSSFVLSDSLSGMDASVVQDLRTIRNIQVQNPEISVRSIDRSIDVGRNPGGRPGLGREHAIQARGMHDDNGLIIDKNNKQGFQEIAFLALEKLSSKLVGGSMEISFDDPTIVFGRGYRYYLSTVDRNMNESVRSRIVFTVVDGLRIPDNPKRVSPTITRDAVSLAIMVGDSFVEKFEVYRKELDSGLQRTAAVSVDLVSGASGFTRERVSRLIQSNGFIQIGEAPNSIGNGGGVFRDATVMRGRKYSYRVYSVDIFGNKSESPNEIDVYVPDPSQRHVDLSSPTLTCEVDAATDHSRITFQCDDERVESLFLDRRDLTLNQREFSPPGQVNRLSLGLAEHAQGGRKFEGEHLFDYSAFALNTAWLGYFQNDGKERVFIDPVSAVDHIYQYRIKGIDRFGNSTSYEISRPTMVSRRPIIGAPNHVRAHIIPGHGFTIAAVNVVWSPGAVDVSSEDRLGDRNELAASSVRTLYQVERKKLGESRWLSFPLVEENFIKDPTFSSVPVAASFRPPPLEINETYLYRIQALQTGSFVSNFSQVISVFVGLPATSPANFRLRTSDTKVRPFYVMLNWDTLESSGAVDRWEIQRADVNNFAAARLNIKNPRDFANLKFREFRTVFWESSRFRSGTVDRLSRVRSSGIPQGGQTITGEHHFMDPSISFGNTYFYRIRAISPQGIASGWIYRGIKITDDVFERKLLNVLTADEKATLSVNFVGMSLLPGTIGPKVDFVNTSFGLNPSFSKAFQQPEASPVEASDSMPMRRVPTNVPLNFDPFRPDPFVRRAGFSVKVNDG